ncbi:hypothetical protein JXM83_01510 [Candidatus Woesearchaeota archaeon]|nr:hypothetical protein [Candidatus Woesearchaeota archaeon]
MIVVSLGGSRIIPKDIDNGLLLELKNIIQKKYRNEKFIFVCGGGYTARIYQQSLRELIEPDNTTLDELGILATKLNAFLVKEMFRDLDNVEVLSGTVPGHSTDFVSVENAVKHGAQIVINFSNIAYVYDKDPRVNDDAKPIPRLTFSEYTKLFGEIWSPGMNIPIDPKAIKMASENNLKIMFTDSLEGLDDILSGKVHGTIIAQNF